MSGNLRPMTDADTQTTPESPPACERCGTTTFRSSRAMKSHSLAEGRAIPQHQVVETWRCPRCGRESPRD